MQALLGSSNMQRETFYFNSKIFYLLLAVIFPMTVPVELKNLSWRT